VRGGHHLLAGVMVRGAVPGCAVLGLLLATVCSGAHARPAVPPPADLRGADALAAGPGGAARDRALKRWAGRASLGDLLYVLRRPASELGPAEALLLDAAFERAPSSRPALRRRLEARLRLADPGWRDAEKGAVAFPAPLYPRASVFTAAALLPDSGDYQEYGRAVLAGIRAGLARPVPPGGAPLELVARPTGEDEPNRVLAAFDAVADRSGALIGELLSLPTLLLATAARFAGLPLVSPTATDEEIGMVTPSVFQVGPAGYERGAALAGATLAGDRLRVGVLVSSAVEGSSFARGFTAAAESLGAEVVWSESYGAGSVNFRDEVRNLTAKRVELLLWDGDAREAEALLRQLARDRVSVRICGGVALAPEQHHVETRLLLEGAQYVGEDWRLADSLEARLDAEGGGPEPSPGLRTRGYLAGAALAAAVQSGALCPEEIAAYLASHTAREPYLRARGFLDVRGQGARLPVYAVRRGRAVPVQ
jgi:ABC-type branched-subunit amino acid transport system substrate-binding protein